MKKRKSVVHDFNVETCSLNYRINCSVLQVERNNRRIVFTTRQPFIILKGTGFDI